MKNKRDPRAKEKIIHSERWLYLVKDCEISIELAEEYKLTIEALQVQQKINNNRSIYPMQY